MAQTLELASLADIEKNYLHRRHFLQTVNLPASPPAGAAFLYMKNHKAACTSILATLMAHLMAERGETEALSMENVHTPPKSLLLTGVRGLTPEQVMAALADPAVFKFTVVREPISRTVSAYADKIAGAQKQKRKLMQALGRDADDDLSLSQFLDLLAQEPRLRDLDRHWRNQCKEISYHEIAYDFIGDVADLQGALRIVVARCFAADTPLYQDTRSSLGHRSSSRELIEGLTAADRRNLDSAFADDLDMYDEVRRRLAEDGQAKP